MSTATGSRPNVQIRIYWDQNILEPEEHGARFAAAFASAYPDQCSDCSSLPCRCPPVIPSAVGRLAHEGPPDAPKYFGTGLPVSALEVVRLLDIEPRTVRLGGEDLLVTRELLSQVQGLSEKLVGHLVTAEVSQRDAGARLAAVAQRLDRLAATQELTQEAVDDLAQAIAQLPIQDRGAMVRFLENVAAGTWTQALLNAVALLAQHH